MHLDLDRTQSGPLTMELFSTVHVAKQWRHGSAEEEE